MILTKETAMKQVLFILVATVIMEWLMLMDFIEYKRCSRRTKRTREIFGDNWAIINNEFIEF